MDGVMHAYVDIIAGGAGQILTLARCGACGGGMNSSAFMLPPPRTVATTRGEGFRRLRPRVRVLSVSVSVLIRIRVSAYPHIRNSPLQVEDMMSAGEEPVGPDAAGFRLSPVVVNPVGALVEAR